MGSKKFKARHGIDLNGQTLNNAYDVELNSNHPLLATLGEQGKTLSLAEISASVFGVISIGLGADDYKLSADEQKAKAIICTGGVTGHPTVIFNEYSPLPITQVFNIASDYINVGYMLSDGTLSALKWRVDVGGSICLIRTPDGTNIFRINPVDPTATRQIQLSASERISGSPQTIQLTAEESEAQVISLYSGSPTPPTGLITVLCELPWFNTTPGPSFQLFKNYTGSDVQYKRAGFTGVTIHAGQSGIVFYDKDPNVADIVLAASLYADDLIYDNTTTGLPSTTLQDAVDYLVGQYRRVYETQFFTTDGTKTRAPFNQLSPNRIPVPAGKAFSLHVFATGIREAQSPAGGGSVGDILYSRTHVGIKNVGGTTSILGTPEVHQHRDDAGWGVGANYVEVTADDTTDSVEINVQGETGATIRWTVAVFMTGNF